MTQPGLGVRAARGATLTLGGQALRILVQLASVAVLARLLAPQDYGLIAMVAAVIGLGTILRDFGLSSAAIQATNLSRHQRDNLFWINTGIGLTLTIAVYLSAGLIAALYDQAALVPITQVLAVTFLLSGLATQFRADLGRRLAFRALAIADVAAPVIGLAVAIAAAIAGWEYWALVAQQVAQAAVLLVFYVISAGWVPGLPHRDAPMRPLLRFGGNLVATQLATYLGNNIDAIIIGVRFGAGPLGIYNRGFHLLMVPLNQLRTPTTTVALPVLSRLANDDERFGRFLERGQLALGYPLVVGLGLVAGAAWPITELLLGERWLAAAPILALLAVAGAFQTLAYVGYWAYLSRGLTGDLFRYTLLSTAIRVACIVAGSWWGIVGVAAGYAIAPMIAWPISLWWLSRRTSIPTRSLLGGATRVIAVATAVAGVAALCVMLLSGQPSLVQLLVSVAGALAVLAAVLLSRAVRADLLGVIAIVRMIPRARAGQ